MAVIALTSADLRNAREYIQVLDPLGAEVRLLLPAEQGSVPTDQIMDGVGGLLLTGGPDVDPSHYGATPDPDAGLHRCPPLDDLEFRLLDYALDQDMPVFAICRGMHVLNVAFGGKLIQDLPGHRTVEKDGNWESSTHQIYLSPGAKAAAIIGSSGFFKVNSQHHQGLREAQRAPRLMTTGYSVEDGLIEALESPEHSWVIGIQCHPERQDEVPRSFAKLFEGFSERAESFRMLTQV
ncbi:MAG: gamma-glutamyl-gamma-aminobutyrate hydrolase family protein [Chloroflexi bacterium]|nr:gamma-glutamyl-gamma-aminobutyrate hydrolase family protein [Chloroflexota bacterium]